MELRIRRQAQNAIVCQDTILEHRNTALFVERGEMRNYMGFGTGNFNGLYRAKHLTNGAAYTAGSMTTGYTITLQVCSRHLNNSHNAGERDEDQERDLHIDAQ